MALKERTHAQILNDELKDQAIETFISCADSILERSPFYEAGEHFKKDRRYKGECFQTLTKEMYKAYNGKCKIPETRFMIFDDGNCIMNVFDDRFIDRKGKLKIEF